MSQFGPPTTPGPQQPTPRYRRSIFSRRKDADREEATKADAAGLPPDLPRRRWRLSYQGRLALFAGVILVLLIGIPTYVLWPREERYVLDSYQVAAVGTRDFRQVVTASGTIEPKSMVSLKSATAGVVRQILVQPGDDVHSGQLLIRLESQEVVDKRIEAQRAQAKANRELEKAKLEQDAETKRLDQAYNDAAAALKKAEQDVPVYEQLYRLGGISLHELNSARQLVEQRKSELARAAAEREAGKQRLALAVATAQDAVSLAREDMEAADRMWASLNVAAPQAGRILSLSVVEGQAVTAGTILLEIADVAQMHVKGHVPPETAASLKVGQPAAVWAGGSRLQAQVTHIAPQAKSAGAQQPPMVEVLLEFTGATDPAALGIRPYTEATCEVEVGRLAAQPALPRGPFLTSGDGGFVYVLDEDGRRATRREVQYGSVDGTYIQVRQGLTPGEKIIYSSYDSFRSYREVFLAPEGGRPVQL